MTKKKPKKHGTAAFHATGEDGSHIVGIGNLRVVILKDGKKWFAQGLEIDYAAQGKNLKDVKDQFSTGLCATLHEHLRVFGHIGGVLKAAPPEVWKEMLYENAARLNFHSQISEHDFTHTNEKLQTDFPFANIEYLQPLAKTA